MDDKGSSKKSPGPGISRRQFAKGAGGAGLFQIVAPHVLGGPKHTPPSETFGAALIGVGGRGRPLNFVLNAGCLRGRRW